MRTPPAYWRCLECFTLLRSIETPGNQSGQNQHERSFADEAYTGAVSEAAWKVKPSWGIVAAADHTVQPDVQREGYTRAGFQLIEEVEGPHLLMQTHPDDVVRVVLTAAAAAASEG